MEKIKTSITLRADTHARLTQQAQAEHRTLSNMVESVIERIFGRPKKPRVATPIPVAPVSTAAKAA